MRVLLVLDEFERENRDWKAGKTFSDSGHELEIIYLKSRDSRVLEIEANKGLVVLNDKVFTKPDLLIISHYGICHDDDPHERVFVYDIAINGESFRKGEVTVPPLSVVNTIDSPLKRLDMLIATIRADGIDRLIYDFKTDKTRLQRLVELCR